MSNIRSNMKSAGYDSEEAYFHHQNQELLKQYKANNQETQGAKVIALPQGKGKPTVEQPTRAQVKKAA